MSSTVGMCDDTCDECENCGMVDVPLTDGHCEGCICAYCKKTAHACGGSMNDMGWCDECELFLQCVTPPESGVFPHT